MNFYLPYSILNYSVHHCPLPSLILKGNYGTRKCQSRTRESALFIFSFLTGRSKQTLSEGSDTIYLASQKRYKGNTELPPPGSRMAPVSYVCAPLALAVTLWLNCVLRAAAVIVNLPSQLVTTTYDYVIVGGERIFLHFWLQGIPTDSLQVELQALLSPTV